MLGLIHGTALGRGPSHFREHFQTLLDGTIRDLRKELTGGIVQRSALGLVAVYNALLPKMRSEKTVKSFQGMLQQVLKQAATDGIMEWKDLLSPRLALDRLMTYGELWAGIV